MLDVGIFVLLSYNFIYEYYKINDNWSMLSAVSIDLDSRFSETDSTRIIKSYVLLGL